MNNSPNYQKDEYITRVNKVIDYIDQHLDHELTLDLLSRVANFSAFHFHRIFKALLNEALNKYIQRVRIEKAANQLSFDPKKSIQAIAFDCGFSSSQFFARVFKEYFKQKPSEWRSENIFNSKKIHTDRKIMEEIDLPIAYTDSKMVELHVEVKNLPDMDVAYVRNIGPYKGDPDLYQKLFSKLFKWANSRDLLDFDTTKVIALYNDNPNITDESKLRVTACITIPEHTEVDSYVGKLKISGGKYAIAHFELFEDEFESAWDLVYAGWLPESGYQPDDKPAFEICYNDPNTDPAGKHIVDICIPVKPL